MTAGIWLLFYDIAAADRDQFVDWFHRYHVPEKLARRAIVGRPILRHRLHLAVVIFIGILGCLVVILPEYFWTQARPS